jgi:hypothetical protein
MLATLKMMADVHTQTSRHWHQSGFHILEGKSHIVVDHTTKTYGVVKVYFHAFLSFALDVKVKFSLEQATNAQRGSKGIALLFL